MALLSIHIIYHISADEQPNNFFNSTGIDVDEACLHLQVKVYYFQVIALHHR